MFYLSSKYKETKIYACVRADVRVFPYIYKNEYYLCVIVNICAFVEGVRVFWSMFLSLLVLPTYIKQFAILHEVLVLVKLLEMY